jgi:ElaB/YqjD/DUF883 family membrane-anchored ribosome-binding protein
LGEAIDEIGTQLKDAMELTVDRLDEFAATSSGPLEEASKKSGDSIQHLNARISEALEDAVKHIGDEIGKFSRSTAVMINSIDSIVSKLAALQTPDQIIEIKLNPMIQGLSRAVNNFGKHAEKQAKAIDENLKQTQELTGALRANAMAKAESTGDNPGTDPPSASPGPVARNLPGSLSNTELRTSE